MMGGGEKCVTEYQFNRVREKRKNIEREKVTCSNWKNSGELLTPWDEKRKQRID